MKMWMKVALVTLACAVPAVALGNVIWPPAVGGPEPTSGQLPFFIVLEIITSITFGLGVAFLLFGFPMTNRAASGSRLFAWAMYLSVGWMLVSWWPHQHLHISNGENLQGLIYIEYAFHVTLMFAGIALAVCFVALVREMGRQPAIR
ncbi:MAG: hypothetical protein M3494_01895 [Actinomycetota bacterium]|jgi:hypothetical protein|nr:hypothetical protein [Rubrobacter sp.]MDQ3506761.1 hypothetical protein [Actinomycetota bacterium]